MTAAVVKPLTRRARKRYPCDDRAAPDCPRYIDAGQTYTRHALPPHMEPNSSEHWWVIRACGSCEAWRAGYLTDTPERLPGEVMP